MTEHTFQLYRLRITLRHTEDGCKAFLNQKNRTYFEVSGENLIFPCKDHSFPMYALAALLPLLPAKQRRTDPKDWMTTDEIIADPDPNSGIQYVVKRMHLETINREDVTATTLKRKTKGLTHG